MESEKNIMECFKTLYNNEYLSDIKFSYNQNQFHGHSMIILAKCPEFYNKYFSDNNKENVVDIKFSQHNIKDKTFSEFIKFIYTDSCDLSSENLSEFIELADLFKFKKLQEFLFNWINVNITVETACPLLKLAIEKGYDYKVKIIEFIKKNYSLVLDSTSFLECDKITCKEILLIDEIEINEVNEMEIYKAVLKWTQKQCEISQKEITSKNKRAELGDLLQLIRFPTMTLYEFTECIALDKKFLSHDELIEILLEIDGNGIQKK